MASDILKGLAERTPLLALLHEKYPGFHPIMSLADIAHNPDVALDYDLQARIYMNMLNYVAPKLASQEVRQEINMSSGLLRVEYTSETPSEG